MSTKIKIFALLFLVFLNIKSVRVFSQAFVSSSNADFGRYGDCTSGRGICGVGEDNVSNKSTSKFSIEKLNDTTLIIKIEKSHLLKEDETKALGKSVEQIKVSDNISFSIQTDVVLTDAIKQSLSLPTNVKAIQIGEYPITITPTHYIAQLKLL